MRIYISGKITGIEQEARALFAAAEAQLLALGHEPINPMGLPHLHDKEWHSFMREDIKALCDCDGILLLHNWQDSQGARLEYTVAAGLGLDIYLEQSFEARMVRV